MGFVDQLRPVLAQAGRRYDAWRLSRRYRQQHVAQPATPASNLDEATRKEARTFLASLAGGYRDLSWHETYARIANRPSAFYLPDDMYEIVLLPALNRPERSAILADKNHFDRMDGWPARPATVGRLMNGRLLDPRFQPATTAELIRQLLPETQLVVKPSRATSTGGIAFVEASKLAAALDHRTDATIQLPVGQHRDLTVLNMSSVNTLRIVTYRKRDGEVVHLGALLRMGRTGSRVDSVEAGGIYCGVDASGQLGADAFNADASKSYQAHPDYGLLLAGRKLPSFPAVRDAYVAAHLRTPWVDLAAWDVAIDSAGNPVTMGIDIAPAIGPLQLACGPLFHPVADDLRARIGKRRYSALLGFI